MTSGSCSSAIDCCKIGVEVKAEGCGRGAIGDAYNGCWVGTAGKAFCKPLLDNRTMSVMLYN